MLRNRRELIILYYKQLFIIITAQTFGVWCLVVGANESYKASNGKFATSAMCSLFGSYGIFTIQDYEIQLMKFLPSL